MKKKYITSVYTDLSNYGYQNVNYYSIKYGFEDDSDLTDYKKWYIMGIDVAEDPEPVKIQKERDKKIDIILK